MTASSPAFGMVDIDVAFDLAPEPRPLPEPDAVRDPDAAVTMTACFQNVFDPEAPERSEDPAQVLQMVVDPGDASAPEQAAQAFQAVVGPDRP